MKQTKIKGKMKRASGRRYPSVDLTVEEFSALKKIWNKWRGGHRGFAKEMARAAKPTAENFHGTMEAKARSLLRTEQKGRISYTTFAVVAKALGKEPDQLQAELSEETSGAPALRQFSPWVTDEKILKQYRRVLHHYHLTQKGVDFFWIYTPIDFTKQHNGCLYAPVRIGIEGELDAHVYGYLFRQMLALVLNTDDEGYDREAVVLYHDFRNKSLGDFGHVGVLLSKDWNEYFGFGGSLLFHKPFPDTGAPGRQSSAVCKSLNRYWRVLGGERCNRILSLFDYEPYTAPPGSFAKVTKWANPSNRR